MSEPRVNARAERRRLPLVRATTAKRGSHSRSPYLVRIPVRCRSEVILVPVSSVATVMAKGQKLTITTTGAQQYVIDYRLKDLESRLDPDQFVRLNRGTIADLDTVSRIVVLPGGGNRVILENGQELNMSRLQSRRLRRTLLRL